MPIIVENEDQIIDVIYETVCGYKLGQAVQILEKYRTKQLIPVEWIERKLAEHWYVDYDIRELLNDWEKENEKDI